MHQHLQHQREHQPDEIKGDELLSFADTNDCSSCGEQWCGGTKPILNGSVGLSFDWFH
jgi:hypothetical protein